MSNKLKRRSAPLVDPKIPSRLVLSQISSALRRLATAASSQFGGDCYLHSALAQNLLAHLGFEPRLTVGHAAWRVNNAGPDTIVHLPLPDMPPQPGGIAYHVWLELGDYLLDYTTYQLRQKVASLNALDGGTTKVRWNPPYLFVPKSSVSPLRDVIQLRVGLYYYARVVELEARVIAASSPLDDDDLATVWLLYRNQELQLFGPNNMP